LVALREKSQGGLQRSSAARQAGEEFGIRRSVPKGAFDFERFAVSLKRYPDTNRGFSASCKAAPLQNKVKTGGSMPVAAPRLLVHNELPLR
jgi:hypothetical protein